MRVYVDVPLFVSPDLGQLTFSLCRSTRSLLLIIIWSQPRVIDFALGKPAGSESPHLTPPPRAPFRFKSSRFNRSNTTKQFQPFQAFSHCASFKTFDCA